MPPDSSLRRSRLLSYTRQASTIPKYPATCVYGITALKRFTARLLAPDSVFANSNFHWLATGSGVHSAGMQGEQVVLGFMIYQLTEFSAWAGLSLALFLHRCFWLDYRLALSPIVSTDAFEPGIQEVRICPIFYSLPDQDATTDNIRCASDTQFSAHVFTSPISENFTTARLASRI